MNRKPRYAVVGMGSRSRLFTGALLGEYRSASPSGWMTSAPSWMPLVPSLPR